MPLLAPTAPVQINDIATQVKRIRATPRQMIDQLVRQWEQAFVLLWGNTGGATPAQRLAALGTDAAELFAANTALVTFLVTTLTGKDDALVAKIMTRVATVPLCTTHPDGTVTID